jgi:hypothetical protein
MCLLVVVVNPWCKVLVILGIRTSVLVHAG